MFARLSSRALILGIGGVFWRYKRGDEPPFVGDVQGTGGGMLLSGAYANNMHQFGFQIGQTTARLFGRSSSPAFGVLRAQFGRLPGEARTRATTGMA